MANPEHVKIVKQGAEAIAKWRKANPQVRLDLVSADLRQIELNGADLSCADLLDANIDLGNLESSNLQQAFLNRASLRDAVLFGTDLSSAYLIEADLRNAKLNRCNLLGADLRGANLSHGDLTRANLNGADLSLANLTETVLKESPLLKTRFFQTELNRTDFTDAVAVMTLWLSVDLSNARGLDSMKYLEPSSVDVDTLFKSRGKIPRSFLKGCGVPDVLIGNLRALIGAMEPIQFYSCFLSHSSKDEEFTKRLHGRMEQEKLRVWYAPEDMRGGRKEERQIDEAIRIYDRLLLVLSEHSMNSEWVRREIKKARRKEKELERDVLFPISLVPFEHIKAWECFDADSGEDLAEKVREYHIPYFTGWKNHDAFEKAFADLMRDLRREDEERAKKARTK